MNEAGTFRLSRGNKGTLFVLVKDAYQAKAKPAGDDLERLQAAVRDMPAEQPGAAPLLEPLPFDKAQLVAATRSGDDTTVKRMLADDFQSAIPNPAQEVSAVTGTWRLIWSQQANNANPLQKFGSAQVDSFQIIDGSAGTLQNLVDLGLVKIKADAKCSPASDFRTSVLIEEAGIQIGDPILFKIPVPIPKGGSSNPGWVDWLYLDEDLRITRGSKGSIFIHSKEPQ